MDNNQLLTNPALWEEIDENQGTIPCSGVQILEKIHLWIKGHIEFFARAPWIGMYAVNHYIYYKLANHQFMHRMMPSYKYYREREAMRIEFRVKYGYDLPE